ncbi:NAD(P)/FAD-dependent oxidoreductase [Cellulosilyticum sp. I15G10I2]|uniref:NAD(P)/FAD-dependent oxidoreductase n=1 Tax=Cellulosilyticum sp. I15G10I2 TaxID=1892843 RepID=UPI00085BC5CE|nr:NAD(P)/FAD-dependent oxidoreductase [Cellulosilyticum sp. I15G10I2]
MRDVIVVGGGASGMIASIIAARHGAQVLLLERLDRIGKKILVTGNGRCNLSNTQIENTKYHTSSTEDFSYPLKYVNYEIIRSFFEELGVLPLVEGDKVYPSSEQASSVLEVLRMELTRLQVEIQTDTKVIDAFSKKDRWYIVCENNITYHAPKVIFATGGMANISFGCDQLGYNILKKLGHTISPTFPTLVHVLSSSSYCKMMKGTKIKCQASAYVENKPIREEYGEVLFTEDGLSGPAIFQLSRIAAKAKLEGKKASVVLDLLPNLSHDDMISMIYSRIALRPERTLEELFIGWIHKRIIIPIIKYSKVESMHIKSEDLEHDSIEKLAKAIKAFVFEINGTRGYKYAQATAGGVVLSEVDLTTMASKKAKGIYITGEVLDLDGDCGGYNLQWAWSTGYLAGLSASNEGRKDHD